MRLCWAAAAAEFARRSGLSGAHITFLTRGGVAPGSATQGYLQRTGQQFHWRNDGYGSFRRLCGLARLAQAQGGAQGAREALAEGLEIEWVTGREHHARRTGTPSSRSTWRPARASGGGPTSTAVFLAARRGHGRALPARDGEARDARDRRCAQHDRRRLPLRPLLGRVEQHPCLHFEVCYYQAIDYAIAHKLTRVEAGAQGEHKLARGYLPTTTYSAHYIADPSLRRAIANYLEQRARPRGDAACRQLADYAPFRKDLAEEAA